jgi:hypothetical protein
MFQHHRTTRMIPPWTTDGIEIDTVMVPVVRALWDRDWRTLACCQDSGQAVAAEREHGQPGEPTGQHRFIEYHTGWAWLKIGWPGVFPLLALLGEDPVFGPRVRERWQKGSWRVDVPVIHQHGAFRTAPYAQVYFPNDQITDLAAALAIPGGNR